jgi:ankyrin repeat protein
VDIVSLLLEHGAKVDLRDDKGHTPLMTALRSTIKNKDKLREVVRVLTEAGTDMG